MKKKMIHLRKSLLTILTLAGILVLASCSKSDSYCSVIPEDAYLLGRVSVNELLDENDLSIEQLMKQFNAPQKVIDKFDELKNSGLDIDAPLYFFVTAKGMMGLAGKMTDAGQFKEFFEKETKESVQEAEGICYVEEKRPGRMTPILCFDDERWLMVLSSEGAVSPEDAFGLMHQDESESVLEKDLYKQLMDAEKPMAVNLDMKKASASFQKLASLTAIRPSDANMLSLASMFVPNANVLMCFEVKGERAGFTVDVFPADDAAKEQFEKMLAGCPKIKGDLIEAGTENPIVWACMGVDGAKYLEQLNNIPFVAQALQEVKKQFDYEAALSSLSGDVVFSLSSKDLNEDAPQMLLVAQTQDDKLVKSIEPFCGQSMGLFMLNKTGDKQYAISTMSPFDLSKGTTSAFLGQKDDCFYVTNQESLLTVKPDNKIVKAYEDDIEESQFFVLFDIQRLTTLLEDQFGNNAKQAEKLSKIKDMKDIVIKGNQFHVEFYLHMMPGKKVSESVLDLASQVCK